MSAAATSTVAAGGGDGVRDPARGVDAALAIVGMEVAPDIVGPDRRGGVAAVLAPTAADGRAVEGLLTPAGARRADGEASAPAEARDAESAGAADAGEEVTRPRMTPAPSAAASAPTRPTRPAAVIAGVFPFEAPCIAA